MIMTHRNLAATAGLCENLYLVTERISILYSDRNPILMLILQWNVKCRELRIIDRVCQSIFLSQVYNLSPDRNRVDFIPSIPWATESRSICLMALCFIDCCMSLLQFG
jgi:hypothetical protein